MGMKLSNSSSRTVRALLAAGSIVFGSLLFATPVASAETKLSEKQIKSFCAQAGGKYTTVSNKFNDRLSSCEYKDENGDTYTDHYYKGEFIGTTPE